MADGDEGRATTTGSTSAAEVSTSLNENSLTPRGDLGQSSLPPSATRSRPHRPHRRMLHFPSTAQPEIIRANQKDRYYLSELRARLDDVLRGLLGTRWLHANRETVDAGSGLAYFSLTTLLGCQTLGEEYCDIIQYSVSNRKAPSVIRRLLLVTLHVLGPYALAILYARLRTAHNRLREERATATSAVTAPPTSSDRDFDALFDPLPSSSSSSQPKARNPKREKVRRLEDRALAILCSFELPRFESLVKDHLRAVHLATFYLFGRYYHWSKRFAGVRYLSAQSKSPLEAPNAPPSYEVLGALMGVQLIVRITMGVLKKRREAAALAAGPSAVEEKSSNEKAKEGKPRRIPAKVDGRLITSLQFNPDEPDAEETDHAGVVGEEEETQDLQVVEPHPDAGSHARRCTLCLQSRVDPTSTACGHVFCWTCIVGWAREKPECPLCRQRVGLRELVPVYNF